MRLGISPNAASPAEPTQPGPASRVAGDTVEELKIWWIDSHSNAKVTALDTAAQTESEGLLEDILARNPDMLADGLKLIGRQTRTTGGPLDLLGVEPDGRLSVFELKRGTLSREAVAQVIDYSSDLEDMDTESLHRHIAEQSGNLGIQKIEDFEEWYRENYADDASLTPLRMVLVGLGVDEPTERMVNYLARSGVDISLLTFHCFEQDGKTLFARQVEVDSSNTPVRPGTANVACSDSENRFVLMVSTSVWWTN